MFNNFVENVLYTLIVCGSGLGIIFGFFYGIMLIGTTCDLCRLNRLKKENKSKYDLINLMVNFLYKNELYINENDKENLYKDFLSFNKGNLFKKLTKLKGHLAYAYDLDDIYKQYLRKIIEGIFFLEYDGKVLFKTELNETLSKLEELNLYCETSLYLSFLLHNYYAVTKLEKRQLTKEEYTSYCYIKESLSKAVSTEKQLKEKEINFLLNNYSVQSDKLNKYIQSCLLERV